MTTSRAITRAWVKLPETFYFSDLIEEVRRLTCRHKRYDKTIYNELQRLKKKYPIMYSYTCVDYAKSIYKKK